MPRVKVSKRARPQQDFVLQPSRLRMFSIYVILFGLAFGAGLLVRYLFNPTSPDLTQVQNNWLAYLVILIGGPVLLALMDFRRWVMRVSMGDQLEGASGPFGERSNFELGEIDWERTRRSLGSSFKIGNGIYNLKGRRILINPWFYKPGDYQDFLAAIGYPRETAL